MSQSEQNGYLKLIKCGHNYEINGKNVKQIILSGQQSINYVVCESQNDIVLYSLNRNDAITQNRINILERVKKVRNVTQVVDIKYNITVDVSDLKPADRYAVGFDYNMSDMVLIIYEYVDFDMLKQSTFTKQFNSFLVDYELATCMGFFYRLVQTVDSLHSLNVFHFDIKPDNILASDSDFLLLDFGSARYLQVSEVSPSCAFDKSVKLAQAFATTEVFSPARFDNIDGYLVCDRFDSYSLGCTLYYVLTGQYLQRPLGPESVMLDLNLKSYGPLVLDLVCGLTAAVPAWRYSTSDVLRHPVFRSWTVAAMHSNSSTESGSGKETESSDVVFKVISGTATGNDSKKLQCYWFQQKLQFRQTIVQNMKHQLRRNSIAEGATLQNFEIIHGDELSLLPVQASLKHMQVADIIQHPRFQSLRKPIFTRNFATNNTLLCQNYITGGEHYMRSLKKSLYGFSVKSYVSRLLCKPNQRVSSDSSMEESGFVVSTAIRSSKRKLSMSVNSKTGLFDETVGHPSSLSLLQPNKMYVMSDLYEVLESKKMVSFDVESSEQGDEQGDDLTFQL